MNVSLPAITMLGDMLTEQEQRINDANPAMTTHFRNIAFRPLTDAQCLSVGIEPADLYWSATFRCWRFCGATAAASPYFTTGQIIHELGLTPDPRSI